MPQAAPLRHHKASGQGYVRIGGKCRYFGRWDQAETHQKFHQFLSEYIASGNQMSQETPARFLGRK